tara:strand:- start:337 stop:1041 length:705 start_codon:yes stop_codon:yes gene_type:complete
MIQDFKSDFQEMFSLIKSNKPFAFMRFADGEIGVMQQRHIIGSDKWTSPAAETVLGKDLLQAITRVDPNVYYGISCQCCDKEGKDYLLSLIKNTQKNITFSNLFVNGNYKDFIKDLPSINKPIYLIANESAVLTGFPLQVEAFIPVPDDCVNYWEKLHEQAKNFLKENFYETKEKLFIVAAGPMSEAIIDYLWAINPNNQYVDMGSAIAEYVHGHPIRDFSYTNSPYHMKDCIF